MKKVLFFAAAMFILAACSEESPFTDVSADLNSQISTVQQAGGSFNFSIESNEQWTISTDGQEWYGFSQTEGSGSATVTVTVDENYSIKPRTAEFSISTATVNKSYVITQAGATVAVTVGDLVIEEIYYAKTIDSTTGKTANTAQDQYVKITNTTDHVVYADRLALVESFINSSMDVDMVSYDPDVRPEQSPVDFVFMIAGDGDDHPIAAGESIIIAAGAQRYEIGDKVLDLSTADFEWYDNSTNENYVDVDNPEITNLDIWYTYSLTVTSLHQQGFKSYAIAYIPQDIDAVAYVENYKWIGTVYEDWSEYGLGVFEEAIEKAYLIPNEWVVDAVNVSHPEDFTTLPFHSSLDAGYAYCGATNTLADRGSKAIVRKRDASGKLIDTNNSTNDFNHGATPSLLK